jgi:hypothetical protein
MKSYRPIVKGYQRVRWFAKLSDEPILTKDEMREAVQEFPVILQIMGIYPRFRPVYTKES